MSTPYRPGIRIAAALWVAGLASPGAAMAASGGQEAPQPPYVKSVSCLATAEFPCPAGGALVRGGEVVVTGAHLQNARALVFLGGRGTRDDVAVGSRRERHGSFVATVPSKARSGRVAVLSRTGQRSAAVGPVEVRSPAPIDAAPGSSYFYDGFRQPTFAFETSESGQVRVEVVRAADGAVVRVLEVQAQPGRNEVRWDGTVDGRPVANGRYGFRLAGGATSSARATAGADSSFALYNHIFPIRGRHNLGYSYANDFGGGRGHRGQDMFAACGSRLVAARGGKVVYAGYQGAAGNYVVIDGQGTGVDYVYMHLRRTPLVRTGQRVLTGQAIGEVGETGRAYGCHLHFEMWSAPGWYRGGAAFDPKPHLRAWDAYS